MQEREEKTILLLKQIIHDMDTESASVLDIGPGDGTMLAQIPKKWNKYAVDIVSRKIEGVEFKRADMNEEELPFEDSTFDLVICTEVIEHLWNPDNLLYQINKKMRLGGHLLLSTPNLTGLSSRIQCLMGRIPGVQSQAISLAYAPGNHVRCYNPDSLKFLLKLYGFKFLEFKGAGNGSKIRKVFECHPSLSLYLILHAQKTQEAKPVASINDGKVHFKYGGGPKEVEKAGSDSE